MEIFRKASTVRLRSHHDKYLVAEEDEETVSQDRDGRSMNARWTVEIVEEENVIRLKSCFGKYLIASNMSLLLGMTGKKVLQTLPRRLDSSTEWEPVREGVQVRLKTRYGQYLRANGGLPPWRNSVTHDIPRRTVTQDWVLWDVDILESRKNVAREPPRLAAVRPQQPRSPSQVAAVRPQPPRSPQPEVLRAKENDHDEPVSPKVFSLKSPRLSGTKGWEGRWRDIDEGTEEEFFYFKGMGVEQLKQKLEEETGLSGISVCSLSPLNGKLCPLQLHLPPNNATMHVVLVPKSSKGEAVTTS